MKRTMLSARAVAVMDRLRAGKFYRVCDKKPKALDELIDAGVVARAGRVVTVEACYVPAAGYKPYVEEVFEIDDANTFTGKGSPLDRPRIKREVIGRMRENAELDHGFSDSPESTEVAAAMIAMLDWYEAGQ